ncbi:MAG: hypothetical protein HDT00_08200, partial [Bacteroidales bacterium]|nr:hypothetical protein [Bacteroidales bacterium]
ISKLPTFTVIAKPMGSLSKFLNLAFDKSELLHSFSYSDEAISITLENGKKLCAPLSETSVVFDKMNGVVIYKVQSGKSKLNFYQTTNISNSEWDAINSVLCLAGTTQGRSMFSKEAKAMGMINVALKAIKAIS